MEEPTREEENSFCRYNDNSTLETEAIDLNSIKLFRKV